MSIKYCSSLLWRTDTKLSVWILSTKKSITFPGEQVFDFCLRIVDDVVFTISSTFFFSLLPLNMPFTHKRDSTGRRFALFQSREVFRAVKKIYWGARGGQWWEPARLSPIWTGGSYPGLDAICGLSLMLVLSFAPRGFFSGFSGFPLSSKTNISKFLFDQESRRRRTTMRMCYHVQILIYLIFLFIYLTLSAYPVEPCEPNKICPMAVEAVIWSVDSFQ